MNWKIENWFLLVALLAFLGGAGLKVYGFVRRPSEKQIETIKEWLLFACIQAEKELGRKTGEFKLVYVYDLFIARFPGVAKMIPFTLFSSWVDSVLEEMRQLLTYNEAVKQVVIGGGK